MKMFKKFFAFLLLLRQTNFRQQINKILSIVFLLTLVTQTANAQAGEAEFPDFDIDGDDWRELLEDTWLDYWDALGDTENRGRGGYVFSPTVSNHNYVTGLETALDMLDTEPELFRFDRNGAEKCPSDAFHIQGIAYYNGYYYLTRSRKDKPYNEQLLIVSQCQAKVVNKMTLDKNLYHPSGIQIYDTILVVPFNEKKTNFYSIKDPANPRYLDSIPYMGQCVGITEYQGNYLVALFGDEYGRDVIKFYQLSTGSLKLIKNVSGKEEIKWKEQYQDKNNWTPYKTWQGTDKHYENMSLIKEQARLCAIPKYYLLMYHNDPEAIDVYSLNGLDFNSLNPPDIQMIRRIKVNKPWLINSGFRNGGGMYIEGPYCLRFFSTEKRIFNKTYINVY